MSENEDKKVKVAPVAKRQFSKEVADDQIGIFMDYYGLDSSDYEPVDNAENQMQIVFNGLRRAIMEARLSIELESGNLSIIHTLNVAAGEVSQIVYTDKIGQANRAMESISPKKVESRKDEFMAALSNTSAGLMIKLKGKDRTLYGNLTTLFSLV